MEEESLAEEMVATEVVIKKMILESTNNATK